MRFLFAFLSLLVLPAFQLHAQDADLDHVTVSIFPYLSYAPFFIAQEEGFFAEQGIEVEFVRENDSSRVFPALLRGDIDVHSELINAGIFNAIARGGDLRMVADKGYFAADHCPSSALAGREDLASSGAFDDPEQLARMRWSVEPGTLEDYILEHAFAPFETPIEVDYEDVPSNLIIEAIQNNSIQAAMISEPWLTRAAHAGGIAVWRSAEDVVSGLQSAIVIFGPRLHTDDPDLGRRFMVAYLQGHRQYLEGKTDRNVEIIAAYTGLDPELVDEACWVQFREDGLIETDGILAFQEWLLERDLLDRVLDADEFWDASFIADALETLNETLDAP